ncbi:hypothetical protein M404DRAFT_997666 [Pisolithus tinctorius Marx 270]|uniref:Uncharacterized protein n=1 Tax=Pisolithus tinctorius Marx 270 TaxID=870435 RepID=A0A0C3PHP3_PISTI|nr:hypothetical protein M404DRAFT_997666 [Pisolithus tinctorius Marx 270]
MIWLCLAKAFTLNSAKHFPGMTHGFGLSFTRKVLPRSDHSLSTQFMPALRRSSSVSGPYAGLRYGSSFALSRRKRNTCAAKRNVHNGSRNTSFVPCLASSSSAVQLITRVARGL